MGEIDFSARSNINITNVGGIGANNVEKDLATDAGRVNTLEGKVTTLETALFASTTKITSLETALADLTARFDKANPTTETSQTNQIVHLSNAILDKFNLKNHEYLVDPTYYDLPSGNQEYKLYSYLTTFFDNAIILDIGTLNGRSAISLSHNELNQVISYNIVDDIKKPGHKIYTKSNIEFRIKNVLDDLSLEFVAKLKIVMIDIDHLEVLERQIIQRLNDYGFSGLILLDDITHPAKEEREAMQRLWKSLNYEKYDVTQYGHWSGTGLIVMNSEEHKIGITLS